MQFKIRILAIIILMALTFLGIISRLACMQIVRYEKYEEWAVNRCLYIEIFEARRASVVTSDGVVVAQDKGVLDISAYLPELDVEENSVKLLARYLKPKPDQIRVMFRGMAARYARMPGHDRPAGMRLDAAVSGRAGELIAYHLGKYPEKYNNALGIREERDSETGGTRTSVFVELRKLAQAAEVITRLSELVGADPAELMQKIEKHRLRIASIRNKYQRRYEENIPVVLAKGVTLDQASAVELGAKRFPGLVVTTRRKRCYPHGRLFAHITGYMRPITAEEYGRFKEQGRTIRRGIKVFENEEKMRSGRCFFEDDRVGARGIEAYYDSLLDGRKGLKIKERNARSASTSEIVALSPEPGSAVKLTIDSRIQSAAREAFRDDEKRESMTGCAVVMDVKTGAVLALVSIPSFDPETFRKPEEYRKLEKPPHGLITRPVMSAFPPGSCFKIMTAIAGLEEGVITPDTTFRCRGYMHEPGAFRCEGRHGDIAVHNAIVVSCNVFFFNLGERLTSGGKTTLQDWSKRFGFGEKTGIDLTGETAGIVPTPAWKKKRLANAEKKLADLRAELDKRGKELDEIVKSPDVDDAEREKRAAKTEAAIEKIERNITFWEERVKYFSWTASWVKGDGRNLGIGQGDLTVTPLQMARFFAAVANGGKVLRPHLVEHEGENYVQRVLPVHEKNLKLVRRALYDAVHSSSPRGTAHGRGLEKYRVAAKTGTAQIGQTGLNHSYLAGFAPYDDPRVSFVVMLERTPLHGANTAPILLKILDKVFETEGIK